MHRSRISVVMIDHPEETYGAAAAFWALSICASVAAFTGVALVPDGGLVTPVEVTLRCVRPAGSVVAVVCARAGAARRSVAQIDAAR